MTVREAGRLGGAATLARYGSGHLAAIARLAGRPSPEERTRISRLGGLALRARLDAEAQSELGRRGGLVTLARHGKEHYRRAVLRRYTTRPEVAPEAST
jgi:hypothetical protein